MRTPPLVLATSARGASGGLAAAAALGVAAAERGRGGGVLLVEAGAPARGRAPTLLASDGARALEAELRGRMPAARVAARGRLCWLCLEGDAAVGELGCLVAEGLDADAVVAYLPPREWGQALNRVELAPRAGLVRADLPRDRSLAALAVTELRERGLGARIAPRPPGRVAVRRALAGMDPGGETSRRAGRWARYLLGERGQALPLVLGACFALVFAALVLAAIGGAVSGKGRLQRAADLAAVSAARSMRDDVERLLAPARLPDGRPNPGHMGRAEYLGRARQVARLAAERNGLVPGRLRVSFPDGGTFAPLRVRTRVRSHIRRRALPGGRDGPASASEREALEVAASAEAEAVVPRGYSAAPETASGGGYAGPLAYRQGKGMRPDVAAAFDRLLLAARHDGIAVIIASAFRSDAEQAELFAQNPDPTWVAPPGKSLHRCATELDLGPPSAYGWLAANAPRFGFVKRYSWEPWHFGFARGPAPCSQAGNAATGGARGDGRAAASGWLPGFVPAAYEAPILRAAARWDVSAAVLAAQLLAESNFNPHAVSPAGAQGIAQFMPGTAAAYNLQNPFDPEAAIDAQAHLMSDLLRQFGALPLALAAYNAGPGAVAPCTCIPPYPETQAYVARILSLLDGAGELTVPPLEVRLVS